MMIEEVLRGWGLKDNIAREDISIGTVQIFWVDFMFSKNIFPS